MAIRNHWKKLTLALFASMWTGCENSAATNPMPEYGCGACGCDGSGCEVVPDYGVEYPGDGFLQPEYGVIMPPSDSTPVAEPMYGVVAVDSLDNSVESQVAEESAAESNK